MPSCCLAQWSLEGVGDAQTELPTEVITIKYTTGQASKGSIALRHAPNQQRDYVSLIQSRMITPAL